MIIRVLLTALLLTCNSVQARDLPNWQSLTFHQTTLWVSAKSVITLQPCPEQTNVWRLTTDSTVASNHEYVEIDLDASSGLSLQRSRFSEGRQSRLKQYKYGARDVLRERHSQPDNATTAPETWPVTGRNQLPYPAAAGAGVINSYSLLLLAADALDKESAPVTHYVHTDFNFYRVESQAAGSQEIQVAFVRNPGGDSVAGMRTARVVTIRAVADKDNTDKADFDIFGLQGEVSIFYDAKTGIPLQLRGRAPRLGHTTINLTEVTMRDKQAKSL